MSLSRRNIHADFIEKFGNSLLAKTFLRLLIKQELHSVDSFNMNVLLKLAMGLTVIYGDAIKKAILFLVFQNQYVNDRGEIKNEAHLLNLLNGIVHLPLSVVFAMVSAPVVVVAAVAGGVVEVGVAIQNSTARRARNKAKLAGDQPQLKFNSSTSVIGNVISFQAAEQYAQMEAMQAADENIEVAIRAQAVNDLVVADDKVVYSSPRM